MNLYSPYINNFINKSRKKYELFFININYCLLNYITIIRDCWKLLFFISHLKMIY